jgi:hypothetical protein
MAFSSQGADCVAMPLDLRPLLWGAMAEQSTVSPCPPSPLDPLTPSPVSEAADLPPEVPLLELPPPLAYASCPEGSPFAPAAGRPSPIAAPPRTHAQRGRTKRRRAKRSAARELLAHRPTRPSLSEKHKLPDQSSVPFDARSFSATKPAYVGLPLGKAALPPQPPTLQALLDRGYALAEWDGRCVAQPSVLRPWAFADSPLPAHLAFSWMQKGGWWRP